MTVSTTSTVASLRPWPASTQTRSRSSSTTASTASTPAAGIVSGGHNNIGQYGLRPKDVELGLSYASPKVNPVLVVLFGKAMNANNRTFSLVELMKFQKRKELLEEAQLWYTLQRSIRRL